MLWAVTRFPLRIQYIDDPASKLQLVGTSHAGVFRSLLEFGKTVIQLLPIAFVSLHPHPIGSQVGSTHAKFQPEFPRWRLVPRLVLRRRHGHAFQIPKYRLIVIASGGDPFGVR